MSKKKLLIVSDYYLPHWTGIVKTIVYMNDAIQRWFDITVLCIQHDPKLDQNEVLHNVNVKRSPVTITMSRTKLSLRFFFDLIHEIQKTDVVLVNSPCTYIAPASIFAKAFNKKLFIFHQGDLTLPRGLFNWVIERVFDASCFVSCFLASRVFCTTEDYARNSRVLRFFIQKFSEFPILAPHKKTTTSQLSTQSHSVFKRINTLKQKGYFIFGFAGRFVEEKGFDILLQAIYKIMGPNTKIHFFYAGELNIAYERFFEKHEALYKRVKKYITTAGLLNELELETFYFLIDALVIPSRSDCFPTVQVEAMLHKKPVIVTDIPGARVPVQRTGFGIIIPPVNVDALINALYAMIKKPHAFKKQLNHVLNCFDLPYDTGKVKTYLES